MRRTSTLSRRSFLKVGGTGLAGAALLGAGVGRLWRRWGSVRRRPGARLHRRSPDDTGTAGTLVQRFNEQNRGAIQDRVPRGERRHGAALRPVAHRAAGRRGDLDIILGDVIWTAQLAANGWISDLSDRFTEETRADFLPGSVEAIIYEGKAYRHAVVHGHGPALLPPGPAGGERLRRAAEDLGRAQGDGPAREAGPGNEVRLRLPGRPLRGRGVQRLRVHLDPRRRGARPERRLARAHRRAPRPRRASRPSGAWSKTGVSPEAVAIYKEDESAALFLNGDAVFHRCWPYVYALVGDPGESEVRAGPGRGLGAAVGGRRARQRHGRRPAALHQRDLAKPGRRLGVHQVPLRPRAAEGSGARRLLPADPDGPLQRPGDQGERAGRAPRRAGAQEHPTRARSRPTTRTCRSRWPSSSTPRSTATSRRRRRPEPPDVAGGVHRRGPEA